jgi:hypothetical protein
VERKWTGLTPNTGERGPEINNKRAASLSLRQLAHGIRAAADHTKEGVVSKHRRPYQKGREGAQN